VWAHLHFYFSIPENFRIYMFIYINIIYFLINFLVYDAILPPF
jgi:hypothetical protein